jgi:anti-sigma factor ChrR (cupin superfamily)
MENTDIFERKVLKAEQGININFIKLKPGQEIPFHKHKSEKYDYILKGNLKDETGKYGEGDLIINKKGSGHSVKAGPEGCEFLVIFNQE